MFSTMYIYIYILVEHVETNVIETTSMKVVMNRSLPEEENVDNVGVEDVQWASIR